jgi:hypothetical protein
MRVAERRCEQVAVRVEHLRGRSDEAERDLHDLAALHGH